VDDRSAAVFSVHWLLMLAGFSGPTYYRNSGRETKLMKQLGYGKEYKYAHAYEGNFVDQEFLPKKIKNKRFYTPQDNASEQKILERLKTWWKSRF